MFVSLVGKGRLAIVDPKALNIESKRIFKNVTCLNSHMT